MPVATSPLTFLQSFDLQIPVAVDPSPDGRWIVYARMGADIRKDKPTSTLWWLSVAPQGRDVTEEGGGHRRLTADDAAESGAVVSPDGTRVAFVSTASGSPQVHVWHAADGSNVRVTNLVTPPSELSWSPDGRWIAFHNSIPKAPLGFTKGITSAPPGCEWSEPPWVTDQLPYKVDKVGWLPRAERHLMVVPAEGGTTLQLSSTDLGFTYYMQRPEWTPDGKEIIVIGAAGQKEILRGRYSDAYAIAFDGDGDPVNLTNADGFVAAAAPSPDGRYLAYAAAPEDGISQQQPALYLLDRTSGEVRVLAAELDRALGEMPAGTGNPLVWEADSSALRVLTTDLGSSVLVRVTVEDGKSEIVMRDVGGASAYSMGATAVTLPDGRIVHARATGGEYPELYMTDPGGDSTRLTTLNESLRRRHPIAPYEEIWVTNPADGMRIQAWLVTPADLDQTKSYPLILDIHGGPHADFGDRFWLRPHALAGQGYCVLLVNPRGSTSYGHDFTRAIEYTYPGPDVGDLLACIDEVAQRSWIDQDKLFVMGGSGGGVLTAALVAATDRFAAAASLYPVIDWGSFMLSADVTPMLRFWFERMPWQDPQAYHARSLIKDIEKVTTPTIVICGAEDHRTPFGQAEILYQALTFAGVDTALVRFPGEPHGIAARPAHNIMMMDIILGWFRDHTSAAEDVAPPT